MNDTDTLYDNKLKIKVVVKRGFKDTISKDSSFSDWIFDYNLTEYLHSTCEPALIIQNTDIKQWWLNGKRANEEEIDKLEHRISFTDRLFTLLDE